MPTTTVAVSSPLNLTSTVTSSQVSASLKDDAISIITTPTISTTTLLASQNHDAPIASAIVNETAQLLSPTLTTSVSNGDESDIIKASVNGNNNNILKNGAIPTLLTSSGEHISPKIALHSPISAVPSSADMIDVDLNIKTSDINCLNVITSSPTVLSSAGGNVLGGGSHFSNGHLLMAQNSNSSLNFQATLSPTTDNWSIGDDNAGGFVNYSSPNNGQLHKRAIMSQQPHHGLSPNSSIARANSQQQQFVHYNKNNCNSSNNFSSAWSNHSGQNSPWQQQQQMQLLQSTSSSSSSQMSLNAWNRGCSVPNLNPLSPHNNMMHQQQRIHQNTTQYSMPSSASSSQQHHQQPPHQGLSPNLNSPSKYRRSTSYPGKSQMHAFPMDIGTMIEDQSSYMNYKVSYTRPVLVCVGEKHFN